MFDVCFLSWFLVVVADNRVFLFSLGTRSNAFIITKSDHFHICFRFCVFSSSKVERITLAGDPDIDDNAGTSSSREVGTCS